MKYSRMASPPGKLENFCCQSPQQTAADRHGAGKTRRRSIRAPDPLIPEHARLSPRKTKLQDKSNECRPKHQAWFVTCVQPQLAKQEPLKRTRRAKSRRYSGNSDASRGQPRVPKTSLRWLPQPDATRLAQKAHRRIRPPTACRPWRLYRANLRRSNRSSTPSACRVRDAQHPQRDKVRSSLCDDSPA